ncbi:MAG TPA: hypothetical protein DHV25_03125 [Candidatus Kerfeldbacteria bacterium]|nr:hypothetical protein [Candidatus Kerfeldbacteria bacterium]
MSEFTIHTVKLVYETMKEGETSPTVKKECVLITAPECCIGHYPGINVEEVYNDAERALLRHIGWK